MAGSQYAQGQGWQYGDPSAFGGMSGSDFGENVWEQTSFGKNPFGRDYSGRDQSRSGSDAPTNPFAFQLPPWETNPEWKAAREEAMNFWGGRMDPGFSMYSPEARASAARNVGSGIATNERRMRDSLGARGISGSGLGEQAIGGMRTQGHLGLADINAQMSVSDEEARRQAAQAYDDIRRFGSLQDERAGYAFAGIGPQYASATGPSLLSGPETEYFDYWGTLGANTQRQLLEYSVQASIDSGKLTLKDALGLFTDAIAGDANAAVTLLTIGGGYLVGNADASNNQFSGF